VKPEPSAGREPDLFVTALLHCFPYQRRRLPLHRVDHLFSDACVSARGLRGEERSLLPFVKPDLRAEDMVTLSTAAPPRCRAV
jgi:hypothetical protein